MDPGNADPPLNQEVITVFAMTLESPGGKGGRLHRGSPLEGRVRPQGERKVQEEREKEEGKESGGKKSSKREVMNSKSASL